MHLRYYLNEEGKRVYTLKNTLEDGSYTFNAHPGIIIFKIKLIIKKQIIQFRISNMIYQSARFSPDDVNQKYRVELKKRFGLLPTQGEPHQY